MQFGRALARSTTLLSRNITKYNQERVGQTYYSRSFRANTKSKAYYWLAGGATILFGLYYTHNDAHEDSEVQKKKLVILGTGWAAMEIVQRIDTSLFDVVVVSPRNYFLFTPLLASSAVGTVEFTSIIEPLRKVSNSFKSIITYYEARCTDVFYDKNVIRCEDATGVTSKVTTFDLPYDYLVIAVGSQSSTMGTKGVQENCCFLKDVHDSIAIRQRIMSCLENASFPSQTDEEINRLLHFVVVGGGPTGVEFSAELHDFVMEDIPKYFPSLASRIKVSLIQSSDHILNTYDSKINAEKQFARDNINLLTNSRVIQVNPTDIVVVDKVTNQKSSISFGMCVWATGIGPTPLTLKVASSIPEQTNNKALVADEFLRVKGIPNGNISVYAVGDCLTVTQHKLIHKLVEHFTQADENMDGALSLDELKHLFKRLLPDYPHLEPYTHGVKRLVEQYDYNKDGKLQLDEFQALIAEVDQNLKSVPSTAQAATQAAASLNRLGRGQLADIHPFYYKHLGSFAYIGGESAVLDTQSFKGGGFGVWWLWRVTYFSKQLSWKNRFALSFDWIKALISGRDISKV